MVIDLTCHMVWPKKKKKKSNKLFFPSGSVVRNLSANAGDTGDGVQPLGWEDPPEKGMTTHSSVLAWKIPRTEDPDGLQSWGHKESDMTKHGKGDIKNQFMVKLF